jgi:hypothetical protein
VALVGFFFKFKSQLFNLSDLIFNKERCCRLAYLIEKKNSSYVNVLVVSVSDVDIGMEQVFFGNRDYKWTLAQ